jgi:hypothetical protein
MPFSIDIIVGDKIETSSVLASGEDAHVITDTEVVTFGIPDEQLKKAVESFFGKKPNDAFLRSPTPWGDLYKTYTWEQVTVHLRPTEAGITGINSTPVVLKTQTFKNNSSKPATFDVSISDQVSEGVESNWSQTIGVSVSQSVSYGTKFVGGETSITFNAEFQKGGSKSRTVSVGQTSGVTVNLDPGQSVKAVLSASRGSMTVRVVFEAYLSGINAVNYNPTFRDHHFWALGINGVRQAVSLPDTFRIFNDIEVGYFSDGDITLEDLKPCQPVRIKSVIRRPEPA